VADPADLRFLEALSPAHAAALRALGGRRRFGPGAVLFHEREPGADVLLLVLGRVKLGCVTDEGREAVLAIREPGDLIGEMSPLDGAPRLATATALEPVEVLAVPGDAFVAFLARTPDAAMAMVRTLSRRLRDADRKRIGFFAQDTVGRVCSRLVELADRFGEPSGGAVQVDLSFTQEELAGWTGSSREAVIKALRSLRELGWIATRRRGVTLLDVAALRRRAL
jgi:CRP/FNR family transcriptional regulator, cyclic AMP receptor protein